MSYLEKHDEGPNLLNNLASVSHECNTENCILIFQGKYSINMFMLYDVSHWLQCISLR